ncbi:MAG: Crp/Fnr family transcriptional regulator [Gemmatimonadota bacterium]
MPFASIPPSLLKNLPERARDRLTGTGREISFDAGERLISLMDISCRLLILEEGFAKLTGVTADGKECILYIYRPGEIVGLHMLMKEKQPSTFQIVAMGHVRSLAISNRDFLAVAREHAEVFQLMTRVLRYQLDRLSSSMLEMTSNDAIQRLARLLLDLVPDDTRGGTTVTLSRTPTHETMAQIIGASRPHTTMLLGELERRGAIQRLKPRSLLVRPAELQRVLHEGNNRSSSQAP